MRNRVSYSRSIKAVAVGLALLWLWTVLPSTQMAGNPKIEVVVKDAKAPKKGVKVTLHDIDKQPCSKEENNCKHNVLKEKKTGKEGEVEFDVKKDGTDHYWYVCAEDKGCDKDCQHQAEACEKVAIDKEGKITPKPVN